MTLQDSMGPLKKAPTPSVVDIEFTKASKKKKEKEKKEWRKVLYVWSKK